MPYPVFPLCPAQVIVTLDDWSKRTTPDLSISAIGGKIMEMASTIPQGEVRAVLMTAWSFIFGVLPLLFASGAGAESRRVIGTTTFWGMLAATILGVAFIPPLYTLFQKAREKVKK